MKLSCLICSLFVHGLVSAQHNISERSAPDPTLYPFIHGVASGDPLQDRVIIWTRLTTDDAIINPVTWRMASDSAMSNLIDSGTFITGPTRDYTIKVDVTGLTANRWYYYEFEYNKARSIVGRTRTAPSGSADSLRFAVVSCACYQCGYFNPYGRIADRNDIDLVLHLGDYFYEYPQGGYGFNPSIEREDQPADELLKLSDYRVRHNWYKLDPNSRAMHQQYPFIITYDDHEFANDAWREGAQNHTPSTEGLWKLRQRAAYRAWQEWMPVRELVPPGEYKTYRLMPFGDLIDFIVIDTRLYRDQQIPGYVNLDTPNRTMLGEEQFDWLVQQLEQSTAKWKVVVNQVMMAPLINSITGNIYHADQWDGYQAERVRLFDTVYQMGIENMVVFTGDIHSAWISELPYRTDTGDTVSIGTEFICTSVSALDRGISTWGDHVIYPGNPHIKWANVSGRGYMIMDFNHSRAQCDQLSVPTLSPIKTQSYIAFWETISGTNSIIPATSPSVRPYSGPPRPPQFPNNDCEPPQNPATATIGSKSATIQWDPYPLAVTYKIQGREVGTSTMRSALSTTTVNTIDILSPTTTYEWRVASSCNGMSISQYSPWLTFTTTVFSADNPEADTRLHTQPPTIVSIYPNPFRSRLAVYFQLEAAASIQFSLHKIQGQMVHQQDVGEFLPGLYFEEIRDLKKLPSGTYLLKVYADEQSYSNRTVVKE